MSGDPFYGKHRGTVVDNVDPLVLGRIRVAVPAVSAALPSSWAMPCVPIAGAQMGTFLVPPIGASVWVEFEGGDPDYPIWVGGFWAMRADVPSVALTGAPDSPSIVLQTTGGNAVVMSDVPGPSGGILLRSATGAAIAVNDSGIRIENGKGASLMMTGPTVTVNGGALVVV